MFYHIPETTNANTNGFNNISKHMVAKNNSFTNVVQTMVLTTSFRGGDDERKNDKWECELKFWSEGSPTHPPRRRASQSSHPREAPAGGQPADQWRRPVVVTIGGDLVEVIWAEIQRQSVRELII